MPVLLTKEIQNRLEKGQSPQEITRDLARLGHEKTDVQTVIEVLRTQTASTVGISSTDPRANLDLSGIYGKSGSDMMAARSAGLSRQSARFKLFLALFILTVLFLILLALAVKAGIFQAR